MTPSEPDHPRAGQWYYKLQLGPLEHKIPPIVSTRWRRVTFIVTSGDRFLTALNPRVRGWTNYCRSCSTKKVYDRMDSQLYWKLHKWAKWRHQRYWQRKRERLDFCDGRITLVKYADTKIQRHTQVQGDKSPLDGDWTYWVPRLGRDPSKPTRVVLLLKRQHGRCNACGLRFMPDDLMEVHHLGDHRRNQALTNLALLHGHCHDEVHRRQCS